MGCIQVVISLLYGPLIYLMSTTSAGLTLDIDSVHLYFNEGNRTEFIQCICGYSWCALKMTRVDNKTYEILSTAGDNNITVVSNTSTCSILSSDRASCSKTTETLRGMKCSQTFNANCSITLANLSQGINDPDFTCQNLAINLTTTTSAAPDTSTTEDLETSRGNSDDPNVDMVVAIVVAAVIVLVILLAFILEVVFRNIKQKKRERTEAYKKRLQAYNSVSVVSNNNLDPHFINYNNRKTKPSQDVDSFRLSDV